MNRASTHVSVPRALLHLVGRPKAAAASAGRTASPTQRQPAQLPGRVPSGSTFAHLNSSGATFVPEPVPLDRESSYDRETRLTAARMRWEVGAASVEAYIVGRARSAPAASAASLSSAYDTATQVICAAMKRRAETFAAIQAFVAEREANRPGAATPPKAAPTLAGRQGANGVLGALKPGSVAWQIIQAGKRRRGEI